MYIDIALAVIVLFFIIIGYSRGILVEFLSLFGLLFNVALAKKLTPILVTQLKTSNNSEIASMVIYGIVFAVTFIIVSFLLKILKKVLSKSLNNNIFRILGSLVGVVKGLLLMSIVIYSCIFLANYNKAVEAQVKESFSVNTYQKASELVLPMLPEDVAELIKTYTDKEKMKKALKESLDKKG